MRRPPRRGGRRAACRFPPHTPDRRRGQARWSEACGEGISNACAASGTSPTARTWRRRPAAAVPPGSDRHDPALRPSRRYMACLIAGAEEHGLPADYVAWLRAVPAADETVEARVARTLIDEVLRKVKEDRR